MSKQFTLIKGGSAAPKMLAENKTFSERRRALWEIESTLFKYRKGTPTPRILLAFGAAFVVLITILLNVSYLDKVGLKVDRWVTTGGAFLIAGCIYSLIKRKSKLPNSFLEILDAQLAAYEPISVQDYLELQESIRRSERFDVDEILMWVAMERDAIKGAAGERISDVSQFLKKRL